VASVASPPLNSPIHEFANSPIHQSPIHVLWSLLRNRQIVPISPLFPRAVIVPEVGIPNKVQREEIHRRTHAYLAVGDHLMRWQHAAVLEDFPDFVGGFERFRLRIEKLFPIDWNRRFNEATALDAA